jgi:hypothetical protein
MGRSWTCAATRLRTGSRVAFSGEPRFKETVGENGTRQYLPAVGHIELLDGRAASDEPQPGAHAIAAHDAEAADDDIPL